MNGERSSLEGASVALILLALAGGIVSLAYLPFLFGPVAFVVVLVGAALSARYRRLGMITMLLLTTFFVIGASIAVWYSRALY